MIGIPSFYWEYVDRSPKLFKAYVRGYLERNHAHLKPIRFTKRKFIVCVHKERGDH